MKASIKKKIGQSKTMSNKVDLVSQIWVQLLSIKSAAIPFNSHSNNNII